MAQDQQAPPTTLKPKKSRRKLVAVFLVIMVVIIAIIVVASSNSSPNTSNLYGSSLVKVPGASPAMDEQEIISFDGSYTALSFNLTAVAQQDSQGYGPAYLLNGYSDGGYWYQIGITYHWPSVLNNTSYRDSGFSGVYEAFAPNGTSVFPAKGGGILVMNISPGDTINLYLAFLTNGTVKFAASDLKTKSSGVEYYSSFGATYFDSSGPVGNSTFFTGLMTEWYHSCAYYGNETAVTYAPYGGSIDHAWLGVDEYNTSDPNHTDLFHNSSPLIDLSQYQGSYSYTYNGATIIASPQSFTTG